MIILAIESSCDDTSVAVVEDGQLVHSCVVTNQEEIHQRTGGVVPEVAAREHIKKVLPTVTKALEVAGMSMDNIDYIAVTKEPGLLGSLLVGITTAHTLGAMTGIPVIDVHHIEGHMCAPWLLAKEDMDGGKALPTLQFPLVGLTVSGGHNDVVYMEGPTTFRVLGTTLDDAAGEAFDKVARMLDLGFPGGPAVSRAAVAGTDRFHFTRPLLNDGTYNVSFSGIKSAVRRVVEEHINAGGTLDEQFVADVACGFQNCVVDVLVAKLFAAARANNVRSVMLTGGVSANGLLRERVEEEAKKEGFSVAMPTRILYSTDNAAMIAARAYFDVISN